MYQALYRKYRPQTFDDVVGQLPVTQTLKMQLQTGKLSHAYLFTGSRGTGKTSSAKILAKAVNCENPQDGNPCNCCSSCMAIDSGACMDVLEIDAASNNGVDNVRDLRDDAIYSPSQVKMRVYIIDEVHMLSISAFNALLKIIEEPPEHLLFILATTELHKVPATILSRCQRFAFRRISQEDIAARLQYVAYQEQIDLEDSAARILARLADGGMRDGLSLLDQCASASTGELTAEKVYACLGIAGIQDCGKMMQYIAAHDSAQVMQMLDRFYSEGKEMGALVDELACLTRDLLMLKTAPKDGVSLLSGIATDREVSALVQQFSVGELVRMMNLLQQTLSGFSKSSNRRLDTELCLLNLCRPDLVLDMDALNARLSKLEDQFKSGQVTFTAAPVAPEEKAAAVEEVTVADIAESEPIVDEAPANFWEELIAAVSRELSAPASCYFAANGPVHGTLQGGRVLLTADNTFVRSIIEKEDVLEVVSRKASAILGRPVRAMFADKAVQKAPNENLEQLVQFGRAHSDICKINNSDE